ncbi:VOC family protein [Kribbella qitaiheensis]|uniref:VOC family protein n=1 Tax=Kribbella qitaiheensis TaxID=1544730 RepID=A0A7G6WVM2_9ACTN|nr:VOC family protein [Kribbella qitaiheensis]QNE18037.1 VOC family protein [Kribbella qitaiheensis]
MSLTLEHVVFDCTDAAALAGFWAQVLQTQVDAEANEFFATVNKGADGPALMFIQVPEKREGKNRLHVDFATTGWAAEVDRIVGLGAKRVGEFDEFGAHWVTLADPEGNVFDLAEVR